MSRSPLLRALRSAAPEAAVRLYRRLRPRPAGAAAGLIVCKVRGLGILIDASTPIEAWRAATYAEKEPETLDWIDAHLGDGDVLWDIGANVGLYALYAAKRRRSCRVYAFEPAATNYARLCRNIVLNRLENVIPCSVALAGRTGAEVFNLYDVEAGAALHSCGEESPYRSGQEPVLRQVVWASTLDDLVEVYRLPQPTLIKLDVDGLEPKILAGGTRVLRATELRSLVVELTELVAASEVVAFLSAGFESVAKGQRHETDGVVSQNHVFVRARL